MGEGGGGWCGELVGPLEMMAGGRSGMWCEGSEGPAYHVHAFITDTTGLTILAVLCVISSVS